MWDYTHYGTIPVLECTAATTDESLAVKFNNPSYTIVHKQFVIAQVEYK